MARPVLILLVLLAAAGLVVFGLGTGADPIAPIVQQVPDEPAQAPGGTTQLERGDAPRPDAPATDERRTVAVEPRDVHHEEHDEHRVLRLGLGDEHLDVIVELDDGSPATRVDFFLSPGLLDWREGASNSLMLNLGSEDGRYRLEGLKAGDWIVYPNKVPELFADASTLDRVFQVPHLGPPPVFRLLRGGGLRGRVVGEEGEPAEAEVTVLAVRHGPTMRDETDDEDGEFSFSRLPPGELTLHARSEFGLSTETRVEVLPGQVTEGILLELPPGGWLEVFVRDVADAPLTEANVILLADEEILHGEEVDEQGRALFGPLMPGKWSVVAVLDEDDTQLILPGNADAIAGETVELVLQPPTDGILVSGVVTEGDEPYGEEKLYFFREGGTLVEGVAMVETDRDGRYELELRAPGPVQVMCEPSGANRPVPIAWVVVPDEDVFHLDLSISVASVHGRVLAPEGARRHWRVLLEREDAYLDAPFPDASPGDRTNDDGGFEFESVRPGRYWLRLQPEEGWYAAPQSVDVAAGERIDGRELRAQRGATLMVVVRNPDGGPVEGASVLARELSGLPLLGRPEPVRGSAVQLDGLPPGRIRVSAQSASAVSTRVVQLQSDEENRVELVLDPGALLVAHAVRGGAPLGASLRVFGPEGDEVTRLLPLDAYQPGFTSLFTSSSRTFGPLPPGRYDVRAEAPDGASARRSVSLSPGDEREVTLEL